MVTAFAPVTIHPGRCSCPSSRLRAPPSGLAHIAMFPEKPVPKSNGKMRPLGIPTMTDRAMQALYLLGLDPIEETLADRDSYGFRPGRCCADALQQCHQVLRGPDGARWILEGDIKSCYDRIGHEWLEGHVPMD